MFGRLLRIALQESIAEAGELLRGRKLSSLELTKECLARIEESNPKLNAFITVTADAALTQAHEADAEIQRGNWRGPLHGIPLGLKDLIDTAGTRTTAASALFKDRVPNQDAEVVSRLKEAGAVLLGKQNLHEFAYGGSSLVSYYGDMHNPWNTAHIAGGSSGGSAAAVAAGLCFGAIGTDTAGSIREPAALCGVVGLKPTYGRVNTRGVIPLSPSLDHVGPITRTVADAAMILQAMLRANGSGGDRNERFEVSTLNNSTKHFTIGIPGKFFFEDLDGEVEAAVEQAVSELQMLGNEIREIELPVPEDRKLQSGEAYAYHAKFVASNPELYQPETLRRIRAGENISSAEILKLQSELEHDRRNIQRIFEEIDVLVTPTTPIPAPSIAELKDDPALLRPKEILLLRNTRPANVWGLPAISIPCGFTRGGLPVGLQIIGAHGAESKVLQLALRYEQATQWHTPQPVVPRK
jgi:aspartyl-tRNA(Asn)/glutamyl-tRNA(Gln) amidotransferase subunit A